MTDQYNDAMWTKLGASGYTDSDHVGDRIAQWLRSVSGWQSGDPEQLNDLWDLYLTRLGIVDGNLNDRQYQWLEIEGYADSDSLSDRFHQLWTDDTKPLPVPPP